MKIKVARKIQRTYVKEVPEKKKASSDGKLPPDEYKEEFPPRELEIDEGNKLVISVKRGGDYGLPFVDVRHYVTSERYTGFTKKGINFPVEFLVELVSLLNETCDECESKGLMD